MVINTTELLRYFHQVIFIFWTSTSLLFGTELPSKKDFSQPKDINSNNEVLHLRQEVDQLKNQCNNLENQFKQLIQANQIITRYYNQLLQSVRRLERANKMGSLPIVQEQRSCQIFEYGKVNVCARSYVYPPLKQIIINNQSIDASCMHDTTFPCFGSKLHDTSLRNLPPIPISSNVNRLNPNAISFELKSEEKEDHSSYFKEQPDVKKKQENKLALTPCTDTSLISIKPKKLKNKKNGYQKIKIKQTQLLSIYLNMSNPQLKNQLKEFFLDYKGKQFTDFLFTKHSSACFIILYKTMDSIHRSAPDRYISDQKKIQVISYGNNDIFYLIYVKSRVNSTQPNKKVIEKWQLVELTKNPKEDIKKSKIAHQASPLSCLYLDRKLAGQDTVVYLCCPIVFEYKPERIYKENLGGLAVIPYINHEGFTVEFLFLTEINTGMEKYLEMVRTKFDWINKRYLAMGKSPITWKKAEEDFLNYSGFYCLLYNADYSKETKTLTADIQYSNTPRKDIITPK
ncbi:MAG: hypothetical protein AAF770_02165 [Bacteroidota bacterium]